MALSRKLEEDNLRVICQRSVEGLHQLFVAWFQGTEPQEQLSAAFLDCLAPDFSHVAPNGQFLQGRRILIDHLQDKYGCYNDRLFRIEVYDVQLLWHSEGHCLCTYEEWQSWLPDGEGEDDDDDNQVHQFGRLSTCLLERKEDGNYRWIHVHETWLEAETPEHEPKAVEDGPVDEETIMTGPQEYTGAAIVDRAPPSTPKDEGAETPEENSAVAAIAPHDTDYQHQSDDEDEHQDIVNRDVILPSAPGGEEKSEEDDEEEEDDENEENTEDDKHLLMLMSSHSLSRDQMTRQDKARTVLEAGAIAFYEIDGADQDQREKRNYLFSLSGKWGRYPQFFWVDTAGTTTFWGDWERFSQCVEKGSLISDLNESVRKSRSIVVNTDPAEERPKPESAARNLPVAPVQDEKKADARPTDSKLPPRAVNTTLLLLVSTQTLSRDQKSRQEEAARILELEKVKFRVVDGSAKEHRERRNQLFRISTMWGKYPQLFHESESGETHFWGAWDEFEKSNSRETLLTDIKYLSFPVDGAPAVSDPDPQEEKATPPPAIPQAPSEDSHDRSTQASVHFTQRVVLLVSSQSLSRDQVTRQDDAASILKQSRVQFQEFDGSLKDNRQKRNALFKISKLWGRYPQVFAVNADGAEVFWGDWDKIDEANRRGAVSHELSLLVSSRNDDSSTPAVENPVEETPVNKSRDIVIGDLTLPVEKDNSSKEEQTESRSLQITAESEKQTSEDENETEEPQSEEDEDETEQQNEEETAQQSQNDETEEGTPQHQNGKRQPDDAITAHRNIANLAQENSPFAKIPDTAAAVMDRENGGSSILDVSRDDIFDEAKLKAVAAAQSPIPQDASNKRYVSTKLLKYAKPLTWENTLVGLSIAGFDIGTSQGPIADEAWYKEVSEGLEAIAQFQGARGPRRKLSLPEMVFPTAHVALEGHGLWLSWDVLDALEDWAAAHTMIATNSGLTNRGVGVLKSKDAHLWEKKQKALNTATPSIFHYDWSFSTPFVGKVEGGRWSKLEKSGMRLELLLDTSVPILFFDDVTIYEDDLHDNGQVEYTVKLRVMPSCAYVLSRLWLRVDNVVVRVRETRVLIDFFGIKPAVYRDVTWRECFWDDLQLHGLPTTVRAWSSGGAETPQWHAQLQKIPEIHLPPGIYKHAILEPDKPTAGVAQVNPAVPRTNGVQHMLEV